ncbi:MAG: Clp protease N-terminal domain-containing protein, partial [Lentimonas sp.]
MNIDFNTFTEKSALAVQEAQSCARNYGQQEIDVWHLSLALVLQDGGIVPSLLERLQITPSAMQLSLQRELEKLPKASGSVNASQVYISATLQKALAEADKAKAQLKDEFVSTEHLFLGLIKADASSKFGQLMGQFGLDYSKVLETLKSVRGNQKVT